MKLEHAIKITRDSALPMSEIRREVENAMAALACTPDDQLYVFADLETSALDPATREGRIMEAAFYYCVWSPARNEFDVLGKVHEIFHFNELRHHELEPVIFRLHANSGLLVDCREKTDTETYARNKQFFEEVTDLFIELFPKKRPILAGSGIHFDYRWLLSRHPELMEKLHYRIFDTTTFLLANQIVGAPKLEIKGDLDHRANSDVEKSIKLMEGHLRNLANAQALQCTPTPSVD